MRYKGVISEQKVYLFKIQVIYNVYLGNRISINLFDLFINKKIIKSNLSEG